MGVPWGSGVLFPKGSTPGASVYLGLPRAAAGVTGELGRQLLLERLGDPLGRRAHMQTGRTGGSSCA